MMLVMGRLHAVRLLPVLVIAGVMLLGGAQAATQPSAPAGLTGMALDARVELAWQPVSGADHYTVYRGTSPGGITTAVTPAGGVTGTSFTDTTAANGTTYYYVARAVNTGTESVNSLTVQATPVPRSCSSGNAVVLENCYAGATTWQLGFTPTVAAGGIEGFATAQSINHGQSLDLKVNTAAGVSYSAYVYRSGYYGGTGGRLYSVLTGLVGTAQPACTSAPTTTGLVDCSNWSTSATITTTANWPSGAYLIRLIRTSNGAENHILFVVRDDSSTSSLLYGLPFSTYEAYNGYGGKSLYPFNSSGANTVAGNQEAVKVSFDRPFDYARIGGTHDWYTRSDYPLVYWLERSGYDVSYQSNTDMELNGARVKNHRAYLLGAHDEYYSAAMRGALEQARDAGVSLFDSGANGIYWKVRYENGPGGGQNRVLVCYKSTATGVTDPSGIPTGTWRDPAGANKPENALLGVMYIGDNSSSFFPFTVRAADGTDSAYRYTALQNQAAGSSTNIGASLVGWEWDARVANGFEPPRVKTLSATAVNGNLIQNNGASYTTGSSSSNAAKYTAASGALVFATGSNHWVRGLALNADGEGEPDLRIQQTATNVLQDMGATPTTPAPSIVLDNPADPKVASTSPQDAETNVAITTKVTATFATDMNAATITSSSFTLKQPGGTAVPATVAYDATSRTATLTPNAQLSNSITYTAKLDTTVKNVSGRSLPVAYSWIFTTIAPPTVLRINAGGPAYTAANGNVFVADQNFFGGSTNSTTSAISGTSDQTLYKTERWGSFSYAIPVTPGTYDIRLHFVEMYYTAPCAGKRIFSVDIGDTAANPDLPSLDICAQAGANGALVKTLIGVPLTDGFLNIQSIYGTVDDPEIAAIEVYPSASSPGTPPSVTTTNPADGATNVGTATSVKATFSRALDASTVTSSSFTLKRPDATTAPATVSYDASSATATLTPNGALASSTMYTARLENTIKASDGTPMTTAYSWTFTTSAPATPAPVRINAGGPAYTTSGGTSFLADQSFTGGNTFSSTHSISGTTDQALYQNERWGQFSYAIPVVNGTYDIKLYFVELYYGTSAPGGTGKRVFSMDILDTPGVDIQNLDIYSQVGANAALVKTISGVSITDGVVNIQSVYGSADDPEVAAIEIVPSSGPPPPPGAPTVTSTVPASNATNVGTAATVQATFSTTMDSTTITGSSYTLKKPDGTTVPATVSYDATSKTATLTPSSVLAVSTTYAARIETTVKASDGTPMAAAYTWSFTTSSPATPVAVRVNAGGGAYTDSSGNTFLADQYFSGGSTFSSTHSIGGTTDPALYQNERWGAFSYAIPVMNGTYNVKLHFVELYYGTTAPGGTGKRVFSVDLPDTPTSPDISNLDIYAQVGANTALVKTITGVGVTDGVLNIQSIYGSADDPEVAAIEIIPSSGPPPPPPPLDQTGQWSAPFAWPGVAVHMSLLPTGNVISWDGFADAPNSEQIWNPSSSSFTPVPYGRNLFCAGHITLADGRTFIAGGHIAADNGLADTTIFDSTTNTWTREPDMSVGRWYPTATELSDGRVLVFSGDNIVQNRSGQPPPFSDASVNSLPEIFNPTTNTWTDLTGSKLTSPLYPFMFTLSNGKVLDAGPDTTTRTFDPQTGTWATIGTSPFDGMSAVMYRPDKIMKSGTWADPDFNGALAYNSNNRTAVIDMSQPNPTWRETAPMAFPRSYHNLTLLPDGTVLANGGMTGSDGVDLGKAVLPAEIWNPDTETWKTVAALSNGREYHSTALLLPDGRILMAGGGQLPGTPAVNQNNAEIYSPPYLFKGSRPTISAAPTLVQYGSAFTVTTPDAANIASVSLIRTPSVTHGFDQNQRFQWLSFTKNSGSLTVQAPAGANTAPPGYYMLFVVNTNGVPSVAKFVRFPAPWEDTVPPSAPTNLSANGGVGQATMSWTAATDNVGVTKYSVYRSATSGFTPDVTNRVGQTTATSYTDSGVAPGTYYYRVKAEDAVGNLGPASNEASATVVADTTAPTVSVTAPSGGATVSGSVTVSANAADNVGVAGVQFKLDGTNLGAEVASSPYSVTWDTTTATNASHTLTAVARDAAGNTTTSATITVTVNNTAPPPPSGLVLAYSFNQGSGTTVPDASGKGNTGTLTSTTWSTTGKYGGALSFNGSSSWVTAADNATLDLTNGMTLEGWVNPTATGTTWRTVLIKQNTNALVYSLYANTDTQRPSGHVFTSTEFDTRGTAAVPLNTWTFLSATYDGATLRFYVNGTQVSSKAVTGSMPNSSGALRIGGNSIWGEYFAGLIDNVRVYNRALTAAEITTDMSTPVG